MSKSILEQIPWEIHYILSQEIPGDWKHKNNSITFEMQSDRIQMRAMLFSESGEEPSYMLTFTHLNTDFTMNYKLDTRSKKKFRKSLIDIREHLKAGHNYLATMADLFKPRERPLNPNSRFKDLVNE